MEKDRFEKIINNIITKQDNHHKDINSVKCGCQLPNRKIITKLTTNLMEVIFPGYFTKCENSKHDMEHKLQELLPMLVKQIKLAIADDTLSSDDIEKKATHIALDFLEKIPKVIDYAYTDVDAAFHGDPAATDKNIIIATYPGIFATTIQRLAHELYLLNIPYIPRIMTEYAHGKTGIDIHPGAEIGKHFFIDHGTGVVIGETTQIGEYVKIYQGVTLGAISTKDGQGLKNVKRHPTIMNNVTIYSDASVLGGDTVIYDNVVIAGNAFITKSVEKIKKTDKN